MEAGGMNGDLIILWGLLAMWLSVIAGFLAIFELLVPRSKTLQRFVGYDPDECDDEEGC